MEFQVQPQSFNEYSGLISFRIGWLDLLAVQGTLKSLLQHYSSKASILRSSAFFMIQLSHPYMTTGKTRAFTRRTFVDKVMSLLFNMLSRFLIAFLPRSKCLNFMVAVTICSDFGAQENIICYCFHFSPSICHEVMEPDVIILVFLRVEFQVSFCTLFSPSSRGSLVRLIFLPLERYHLQI